MKRKILSLILVAVMLLNIEATSVFAADVSTLPVQEGGTTIDASGDVDHTCACEAVEGETHAEDCPQYIAPDEPEQPVDPSESAEPEQNQVYDALLAADDVSYVEYSWDSGTSTLSPATQTTTDYTVVDANTTAWEDGKTYVVNDTVTIGQRVTIEGSVSLILADGCALTVNGGIEVLENETLTIFAQSGGTGGLTATASGNAAGIGGTDNQTGGTVNIHGGTVIATASGKGSGIGGSADGRLSGAGGTVNIYSGSVTATGLTGIGCGSTIMGGGTTNIYGGFVTAKSNNYDGGGAGIGGVVTAIGGEWVESIYREMSAGIGGGFGNHGGAVTISGGIVNADAGNEAAAIGNGENGSGVAVTRTGGMIFEKNSGKLYGTTFTLPADYSTPAGKTLTIAAGQTLVIPAGRTLTVNGLLVNNGRIENDGTLILGESASQVSGSGHIKCEKKAGKTTLGDGIYRTASDGEFQTAVAGETVVEGAFDYFEYVGEGHLTATAADVDSHTIACKDASCPLYLSGVQMGHDMSGQVCTTCGYTFYDVWVSSVQVSGIPDANGNIDVTSLVGDASKVSGTVTYAPSTRTLTLSGASITGGEVENAIYSEPALNLVLTGENSITGDYGILINRARLTIGGSGSLTLDVNNYGISAYSLMVEGVTVNIDSGTANTGAIDLDAGGTIKDSTVKAVGKSSDYKKATIYTDGGTLEIDSSSVYVECGYVGLYGNSDVSVILNGDVHVKVDGKIMVSGGVTGVNDGYLRGTRGGTFEHKEAGALESTDTYFEYVGEGHYTFSPVAGSEEHAIICVDDDCILKLTNAVAPHIWNEHADGAACGVCKAEATASVTADSTTAYYGGIDNAVSAAEGSSNAILKLLDDVETIAVTQGGFILNPNGQSITKLSLGDDSQPISIAARPANIPAVSAVDYGVFAKPYGGVALEAEWFTSDMTGYVVVKDGDNLKLTGGITEAMVTLSSDSFTYSGRQQTPTVTVEWTDGNGSHIDLTEGRDYSVIYKDSKGDQASPTNADTYTVVVTGMGGYAGKVETTYTIEPKSLADATVAAPKQTYTGSRLTPKIAVTLDGYDVKATDYDVSYSPDTLTDAGSYTITVIGKGNFTGEVTGTFTIDQATALTFSGEMNVANKLEHSYTFDLSTIVPDNHGAWESNPVVAYELGSVSITDGYYDGNNHPASISGHILTLPIQEVDSNAEGFIGTVTVTIKSQNYEDSTLTITVNSANKETVEITGVTAKDGIYNGSAQQGYTGTPTSAFGATGYEITYTGRGSTSYDSATAPTGAGDYTVTFKVPDSNPDYMGAKSLDFSIAPKPLFWNTGSVTVSQAYVPDQVDVEDTSSISSITLSGVISGDDVNWTGTVQSAEFADDDIGENKTVTVTLTGLILTGTDAANYTAPATTFTITGRITDPENTNGDETLGTLEGGLIVSGDELPTDDEMNEVYGTTAAEALRTKFGSTNVMESIQTALKEAAAKTAGANSSNMNHKVLEIFLEYYDDTGKWVRITEDNLDEVESKIPGGVPVTIPFDLLGSDINSSNYSSYDFLLHHMITLSLDNANVGDIEQLTVTVDANGLHATVENGFSPFVISYAKKPTGSSGGSSSGSSGDSSSSDSSSGGSVSTYKDGEYDFWIGVKAQIEVVKSGTTLQVSAGDYSRMPIEVMNALRARSNVTLNITWNGGNNISIPSALAPTPESHRVYYELSELATVFPAKAAAVPVQAADTDTEEESPVSTSPATGNTDGETSEPEGEEIATEEETTEGIAPETEEMIQEETGEEETKEGCIWHWLMPLFMLACVLFIVIGERKPLKTALIALGVDATLTVIVMIAGSCSLDIPFALGTLLVAGASIPVKNVSRNCE